MHLVESMAYSGSVPWHGLGETVEECVTPEEMLVKAGLNWPVHCLPVRFKLGTRVYETTETRILVREYKGATEVMGPAGPNYVPVQNAEVMKFFQGFTHDAGVILETAGSLDEGKQVWALARFKDNWQMLDEQFKNYLLIVSPHVWGQSLRIFYTPVRVVCNNTLTIALKSNAVDKLRYRHVHYREFDTGNISKAQEVMKLSISLAKAFEGVAKLLAATKANDEAAARFFAKLFVPAIAGQSAEAMFSNSQIQGWMGLLDSQTGGNTEAAHGTYWGLFNTVTFNFDHVRGNSRDARMESAWLGSGAAKKREAFELAMQMALAS
jgi:phage/plasmid-like protein (TIGR03299 family)